MGEKDAFGRITEELVKRVPQLRFVRAVLPRQKCEPMRRKVNQRVTDNERAAVCGMIECNFARSRALQLGDFKFAANCISVRDESCRCDLFVRKPGVMTEERRRKVHRK